MTLPPDDPWQLDPAPMPDAPRAVMAVASLPPITPLTPRSTGPLPDPLHSLLFGAIEGADATCNTYAVLDAAKVAGLPDLLESSGCVHDCLFRGAAREDLGDVAPWIVQLDADDGFTRTLFTRSDADWHLWDKHPGIFLRSSADLPQLVAHFRKFTKVRDENNKWLYFRFWEPAWTERLVEVLTPDQLARLMQPVERILSLQDQTGLVLDRDRQIRSADRSG